MKLPIKLKIGPFTYKLVEWHREIAKATRRFGECDSNKQVIRIDTSYGEERTREIIIHEILHALWRVNDVPVAVLLKSLSEDDHEEAIVGSLSTGLVLFAQDNPELWKWLSKRKRS